MRRCEISACTWHIFFLKLPTSIGFKCRLFTNIVVCRYQLLLQPALNNLHFVQFLFNLHHNTVTVVLHIPVYPCHASPHLPSRPSFILQQSPGVPVDSRYIIFMKTPNKWKVKVCPNLLFRNAIKIECDCYYLGPASPLTCCWPDTWCMGECNEWTAQADPGRTLLIARGVHIKNNILTQPRKIAENVKNVYCF